MKVTIVEVEDKTAKKWIFYAVFKDNAIFQKWLLFRESSDKRSGHETPAFKSEDVEVQE